MTHANQTPKPTPASPIFIASGGVGASGQQLVRTALAQFKDAGAIDLIGRLLSRLTNVLGQEPLGQPGLYRQMHQGYFERVEAIEFTVAHDDGRNPHEWHNAEIVPAWR